VELEFQTKWNNGITFIGGSDNSAADCNSTNVTNGYQIVEDINVSNNSFVNTNAPLFYNTSKGTNDPTGTVNNNLIYFAESNSNISDVISGDNSTAFADMGTGLDYLENIYVGTILGETSTGFVEENGLEATADGEIFTFSGSGSEGKGADLGEYEPATDALVGYGIGACFLDYQGENINNGDCEIEVADYLTVGNVPLFPSEMSSANTIVNTNVSWTATVNDSWITIDKDLGAGNETILITVTANLETSSRTGTVTFIQDAGGADIERTLTVSQQAADITDLYDLINIGTGSIGDKVTVHSFSKEEVNGDDKFNYASNTLDKDNSTVWAADDGPILDGDYKGDGEYIIYDLSEEHTINLIQYTTTNKSDAFGFQIWVSTTGTEDANFSKVLPVSEDILLTEVNTTDFNLYEVDAIQARYVKVIGYGRYNSAGDTRVSVWSAIGEIEFYGDKIVAAEEENLVERPLLFPSYEYVRGSFSN